MAAAAADVIVPGAGAGGLGDIEEARIARQEYKYIAARVQSVVHVPLVVSLMLYPTVLGFCLAVRLGRFNLMIPTPHLNTTPAPSAELGSGKDLWRTATASDIAILFFTLTIVTAADLFVAAFLLLRSAGGAYLTPVVSAIPPLILWAVTSLYFFYFVSVARYQPGKGEWAGAGGASLFILGVTGWMINSPWMTDKVVLGLYGPGARANAVNANAVNANAANIGNGDNNIGNGDNNIGDGDN